MAQEMRIFISSTFEDLKEHRQATHDAIHGLDLHADDMLFWSADDRSGAANSLDRVRQADVVIVLLAHRYGYVPEASDYSVTELEYRAAREAGVPVLAFFLDPEVPWPPDHVEWEARDRLRAFKQLIEAEVTRKLFRSPEDLAVQVTQALALLRERSKERPAARSQFAGHVPEVSVARRLTVDPDLLVQIGTAEDGLPLVLSVRRSRDLSGIFDELAQTVSSPSQPSPVAMLETFRQTLEQHATATWAAERVVPVRLRDGQVRDLYVSPFTLSEPFVSMLAALLDRRPASAAMSTEGGWARSAQRPFMSAGGSRQAWRATVSVQAMLPGAGPNWELQSSGGSNRFLGMSPDDGSVYSVGSTPEGMVEWRSFLFESAVAAFPGSGFQLRTRQATEHIPLPDVPERLRTALAGAARGAQGAFDAVGEIVVPRQAIVAVLVAVAQAVAELHDGGLLHGDLKPHNILATSEGVVLIDSFDVVAGYASPGWTPKWSAPEQVLGLPLAPSADVYSMARMVGRLLGGQLVGEVRRYRAPRAIAGADSFELVHDPSLYLGASGPAMSPDATAHWRQLVERALRFDPDQREPQSMRELERALRELGDAFPLPGDYRFSPSGRLMAARMIDGTDVVARGVGLDSQPPRIAGPPPPPIPQY